MLFAIAYLTTWYTLCVALPRWILGGLDIGLAGFQRS
jgi:hypothetical protein